MGREKIYMLFYDMDTMSTGENLLLNHWVKLFMKVWLIFTRKVVEFTTADSELSFNMKIVKNKSYGCFDLCLH